MNRPDWCATSYSVVTPQEALAMLFDRIAIEVFGVEMRELVRLREELGSEDAVLATLAQFGTLHHQRTTGHVPLQ